MFNGALTLPMASSSSAAGPEGIIDISAIPSARYIGFEMISNWGHANRVGLNEVAVTKSAADMNWVSGTGNWSVGSNWDSGLFTDRNATINVSGSVVTVDAPTSTTRVSVGATNTSSLVVPSGNTLTVANDASIGTSGSLTVDGILVAPVLSNSGTVAVRSTSLSGVIESR